MSSLGDLLTTLDMVNRDAERLSAQLAATAKHLKLAAGQAASATRETARPEGIQAVAALEQAQRAVTQASQQLYRVGLSGKSFILRHAPNGGQSHGTTVPGAAQGYGPNESAGSSSGAAGPSTDAGSRAYESEPANQASADFVNSPDNEALISALTSLGLSLQAVNRFDFADNPVLGYRLSAPPEDVAYAVTTWNNEIAPGIAAGARREDFAAYDQQHGLEGHRQLVGVYDYMLGDDAIKSGGERMDGSLDVTGGRHRLEQARLNGVYYLPVRM